jgi:hypothetical protein
VVGAFTDFTPRRTQIWSDTLDPAKFEVIELGENTALVREGSASPSIWALERYDWSTPGTVRWAAEDSNFCQPGSGVELAIEPREGGSTVTGTWHRSPKGVKGAVLVTTGRLMGARMFPKSYSEAIDRYVELESTTE